MATDILNIIKGTEHAHPLEYALSRDALDKAGYTVSVDDVNPTEHLDNYHADIKYMCGNKLNPSEIDSYWKISQEVKETLRGKELTDTVANELTCLFDSLLHKYPDDWKKYIGDTYCTYEWTVSDLITILNGIEDDESIVRTDSLSTGYPFTPRLLVILAGDIMSNYFITGEGQIDYRAVAVFEESKYKHVVFERDSFGPLTAGTVTSKGSIVYG